MSAEVLHQLFGTIKDRQAHSRPGSYTAQLLSAGEGEILKKVGEEAVEVILAGKSQGNERLISRLWKTKALFGGRLGLIQFGPELRRPPHQATIIAI